MIVYTFSFKLSMVPEIDDEKNMAMYLFKFERAHDLIEQFKINFLNKIRPQEIISNPSKKTHHFTS